MKKSYRNEIQARLCAASNAHLFGDTTRAYRCPHGNGWHLTRLRANPPTQPGE